jgi:hypothetical protein
MKPKSDFNPGRNRDKTLDKYIDYLSEYPLKKATKRRNNLSQAEVKAIKELKENKNIVIKQADKGGAFVILNSANYKEGMAKLLKDTSTYNKLNGNKDNEVMKKIRDFCKKYSKSLTKEEVKFISEFDPTNSNIYGLPKIHKCIEIIEAIKTQNSEYMFNTIQ